MFSRHFVQCNLEGPHEQGSINEAGRPQNCEQSQCWAELLHGPISRRVMIRYLAEESPILHHPLKTPLQGGRLKPTPAIDPNDGLLKLCQHLSGGKQKSSVRAQA